MKTKEELNAPKEEVETQDEKIKELTDEELAQVTGGVREDAIPSTLAPDEESSSGPLDLGLKSEYKDNFNMPNQIQWEHFDLER